MIPVFEVFGKSISAYMILALIGYLVTLFVMVRIAIKNKLDEFHMLYMILFAAIGVLVGGHLLYGITNIELIVKLIKNFSRITSFKEFIECLTVIFGGSVFYGGMIGAVAVALIYVKKQKINSLEYVNAAVMAIPLFHFFGRIGCFLSGCCYGAEWESGITYHYAIIDAANGVPRVPVQLFEAMINIILFFILLLVYSKTKFKFLTVYIYFLAYSTCRFFLEYLRGDEYRGFLFGFSTSQIISILLIVTTLITFVINKNKLTQLSIMHKKKT